MKLLFYGGAFNPVTKAHIDLAYYALKKTNFDKVLFVPSKCKYISTIEGKDFVFEDAFRKSLLLKCAYHNDWMLVSDYELKLDKQPRTYQSLTHFKNQGHTLKLLIGSDWLLKLKSDWKHVDNIAKEFGFVCMARNKDNIKKIINDNDYLSSLKDYILTLQTPPDYQNISSSKIRHLYKEIKEKTEEINEMLPIGIDYSLLEKIKGGSLYEESND